MEWKEIFEGNYEVSSTGIVRRKTKGRGTYPGKVLKLVYMGMGYFVVNPVRNGKNVYSYVHVLVANAFLGTCPEGLEVNHIDGNKLNNSVDNLEYVTHEENMAHARRLGLINDAIKYSDELVAKVRELALCGLKSPAISRQTGISARHCRDIIQNKRRLASCQ
jgi:hypothetical protein